MVSSRRLAREWALKILYQIDVGKHPPHEAIDSALETLRKEFVHRGSHAASGSHAEEIWLEWATNQLHDSLPTLRLPFERAVSQGLGRLCEEAVYWQELRLERAFKTNAPGLTLAPPRLLIPFADKYLIPTEVNPTDGLSVQIALLTPVELKLYRMLIYNAREEIQPLFDKEGRKEARRFAKEMAENRPIGGTGDYLFDQREAYNEEALARWRKVGAVVTKQLGDWLRTAAFAHKLVQGVLEKKAEIDAAISGLSSGWSLERQVAVDRNIMRIAGYEMLFLPGIPTGPSINEAVELAKKYSTAESGRFVNGVLGALAGRVGDKLTPPAEAADAIETEKDDTVDLPDIANVEDDEE